MTKRRYSPCVGYCSTTFGDDICKGCKRTWREVDNWNTMTMAEREVVWLRLEAEEDSND